MKMKKILAAMAVSAITASAFASMGMSASAAAIEYPESIKFMVAGGWGAYTGGWDNDSATADNSIDITSNGTYTIHVASGEAGELGDGQWAMALRTTNFVAFDYGDEGDDFDACLSKGGITLTVDSVKINGVEKLTGKSEVRNDDDGNNMRVNIYNQWTTPKVAIVDGTQTFDGDVEVTFTVAGLKFGSQAEEETTTTTEASGDSDTTTTTAASGETTTTKAGDTTTTKAGDTTTTKAGATTAAKTTAKAASGGGNVASAGTGDAGVGIAVASLAAACAVAFVARKKD